MWKDPIANHKRKLEMIKFMKPMCYYFLLSGVFPYKMEGQQLKFSKLGIFQTAMNLIIMLIGYSHLFIGDPFNEVISKIEQTQFATLSILMLVVFVCQFKTFRKHLDRALNIGSEIIDVAELKKKFKILAAFEITISSGLITLLHISPVILSACKTAYFYDRLDNKLYIFFLFFTNNLFLLECIFINFALYLKECFRCINQQIVSLGTSTSLVSKSKMVATVAHMMQENISLKKLRRLVQIRQRLLELTIEVNKTYFALLLTSSWISLFEIMFSAYYAVVFIIDDNSYDYEQDLFHNYLIAWMLYHSLRFIFVCFACDQLTDECKKTGTDIHKLINNCSSSTVAKMLYEYSYALYNYRLQISAMRFFNVDLTLCNNVIAGIFTYLIILLQFRFTPSPPVQKLRYEEKLTEDELRRMGEDD